MRKSVEIAIVFSTYNGSDTLPEIIHAYNCIDNIGSNWRIIAVDNASTDNSFEMLSQAGSIIPLKVIREPRPGKNRSLNLALRSFERYPDLIIFTDDDAIPEPDFLSKWEHALNHVSGYDLFGGSVELKFRAPPERWLGRYAHKFPQIYALNVRSEDCEDRADMIFGPNMAVRGHVFAQGFTFDESIGPNSDQEFYAMGSETEFCARVEREIGCKAWFAIGPKVKHIVRPWQMTPEFVTQRAYRHGKGTGVRHVLAGRKRAYTATQWNLGIRQAGRKILSALGSHSASWEFHWHRGYEDATRNTQSI